MKQITLLAFFILSSQICFGESYPGYIINLNNEKVNGYLYSKNKKSLFKEIGFSTVDTKKPERIFSPEDLLGFGLLGTDYISVELLVEDKFEVPLDGDFTKPPPRMRKVFLTREVKGKASLYSFIDSLGEKYFFLKMEGGDYTELLYYAYVERNPSPVANETPRVNVKDRNFERVFEIEFASCKNLEKDVSRVQLTRNSLKRLVEKYNMCVASN